MKYYKIMINIISFSLLTISFSYSFNVEQLELIKKLTKYGSGEWNKWRKENQSIVIDLSNSNLQNIGYSRIDLHDANLSKSDLSRMTQIAYANFKKANLSGAKMLYFDAQYSIFVNANFSKANLSDSKFLFCNFNNTNFKGAVLVNVSLYSCSLNNADFRDADLSNCDLGECNLMNIKFERAKVTNVNVRRAIISRDFYDYICSHGGETYYSPIGNQPKIIE